MSRAVIRCAVCKTAVDLDWDAHTCRHGAVTCIACDERDACRECADTGNECPVCEGNGETWDGYRREHDTGQPITAECHRCHGTGERTPA